MGALASFYDIQTISALNPQGLAELTVSAAPSAPFMEGEDVTVVLRAAKVWVTVLGEDTDERSQVAGAEAGQAQDGTAWPKVKRVSQMSTDPWGGPL